MMIERTLSEKLLQLSSQYPIVTLTGPRQSGKSTLLRNAFPEYTYLSLEDLDIREFANADPRGFLSTYGNKVIIDEVQRVPALFSYLQTHVDKAGETGMFMLAGSQNFQLMESINQSLAGRTAVLRLLPFSRQELLPTGLIPTNINAEIFTGSYPRIYDKSIAPTDYYPYYIQTYVERDVRQLKNIGDLSKFVRFLKLCAGRIGQLLNLSSLANECGIKPQSCISTTRGLPAHYLTSSLQDRWTVIISEAVCLRIWSSMRSSRKNGITDKNLTSVSGAIVRATKSTCWSMMARRRGLMR